MRIPYPFIRIPLLAILTLFGVRLSNSAPSESLHPVVEIEEDVYSYEPANNGAGPMWCSGSTSLVRIGQNIYATGLETLKNAQPLNNCRWMLFKRGPSGWEKLHMDEHGRTREPSPIVGFSDGNLFVSANPTLGTGTEPNGGPARPEIIQFSVDHPERSRETIFPIWEGTPRFSEHSYRSFAADGMNQEMIIFQNIGYTHAEWSFRDRKGNWSSQGKLKWPWGDEYDKPQPIRICYPNVALNGRAVYFCGVSDIIEPYNTWRAFKKELTGNNWDYDFRRLFLAWTPDISNVEFSDWLEISSRDKTAGWISPGDLWVSPEGAAHIVWTERAIDERLKAKFFPSAEQSHSLNYAVVRDGKVALRRTLLVSQKGGSQEVPSRCRLQVTSDNRLFVIYYVNGRNSDGQSVAENRVMEIFSDGGTSSASRVPLKNPFANFFTATVRAGSPAGKTLELLGQQIGKPRTISYAKIRLW